MTASIDLESQLDELRRALETLQAAVNSLGTKGGMVLFPGNFGGVNTIYQCASGLNLVVHLDSVAWGQAPDCAKTRQ